MNPEDVNLKELRKPLEGALMKYEMLYEGLRFGKFGDFALTPEKPNSARTIIPASYADSDIGDLYAIAFFKGDGTGDKRTYKLDEIVIPEKYQHEEKPERVIPRSKAGVFCEGFFPLFSMDRTQGSFMMHTNSLDELTVSGSPPTVTYAWTLGLERSDYLHHMACKMGTQPKVSFTTGFDSSGKRFGDPHSIYDDVDLDAVQVAGFLAITRRAPFKLIRGWKLPKGYV
jgi:hypothetical protein